MEKQAYIYLTDEETGELVRIPESRLEQYQRAQSGGTQPVSRQEIKRLMERLKSL